MILEHYILHSSYITLYSHSQPTRILTSSGEKNNTHPGKKMHVFFLAADNYNVYRDRRNTPVA